MDKLKNIVYGNKKCFIFLVGLLVIGLIFGSSLPLFISVDDKKLVSDYLRDFILNVFSGIDGVFSLKNGLINNIFFSILIWLFGISIIGIPIVLFMFFSKVFIIGFSISSIIINYGFKGILFSIVYIFPHQAFNTFIYGVLVNYSLIFSFRLFNLIFRRNNASLCFEKYFKILIVALFFLGISLVYESFVEPMVLKFVFKVLAF